MEYRTLGGDGPQVSRLCLGTMTWGEQNSEAEAHDQLDLAVEHGINFIDTAEIYPSPPRAETCGLTERYLGNWLRRSGKRDAMVIATKVAGRSKLPWLRDWEGGTRLDRRNIEAAVEGSLRRLGTDYIDLLQLHWPERKTNIFGRLEYRVPGKEDAIGIGETLEALGSLVTSGKVRHVGVCNETPWGVMRYLEAARSRSLPKLATVQNPYNLLNRSFEIGLAEVADREGVGLMAYSPLSMGMLTGKYLGGARPEGARLSTYEHFQRFLDPRGAAAAERYVALAGEHGLSPAQLALRFVVSQPWTLAAITAGTRREHLLDNFKAVGEPLTSELTEAIDAIHADHPNPCP